MSASGNTLGSEIVKEIIQPQGDSISDENIQKFFEYLDQIRYGSVTLTIQDGKVVQIDKIEKIRIR
jgi:hypothetical protein